jgi:exoribonuclease-2
MTAMKPTVGALVLYKVRPARVLAAAEKIEIELEGGQTKRVRPKDVAVLHPGPLKGLGELVPCEGELEEAWELLEGGETHIQELAELMFSDFTPSTAWAAWQWVADGLYFSGTPDAIGVHPRERVERDREERETKARARQAWEAFIARLGGGSMDDEDRQPLGEVERVALGQSEQSRIMDALGRQVSPENAHRLLVSVGYWSVDHNPYPARCGVSQVAPELSVPPLPDESRRDLTGLPAFAIDDEGNEDPDDAISIDGDRIWVHVADVAALVPPDSPMDLEARARGSNLYSPECIVPMLPDGITRSLGLGLAEQSPALSIGFRYRDGVYEALEIVPSWIRAQRTSYQEVNGRLHEEPFHSLLQVTEKFREHRHARDAAAIDLPEVNIRVVDGEVRIRPQPPLRSRAMVTDAMLMAGEAVAGYCRERDIPIPYAGQPGPDEARSPDDLAAMWAYRKCFQPSRVSLEPAPHFSLGLDLYTRATSPLRRYSDLLVHQQLRAHLAGREPVSGAELALRIDQAETAARAIRRAERQSNLHWKLVWLRQHPGWQGEAVVVENDARKAVLLIPELAMDARVKVEGDPPLNARVQVMPREIDLPDLTCYFSARPI